MVSQINQVPASLEPVGTVPLGDKEIKVQVSPVWYKFFVSLSNLTSGGGGGSAASALLDTIGSTVGGMLARFGSGWQEFVASSPNQIPVMNPATPVTLKTVSQILDTIGGTPGDVLFRGAAGWEVLPPVNGAFLQSAGPDLIYGQPDVSTLLDLSAGNQPGGLLARGAALWQELIAGAPNLIPVMTGPPAPVAMLTISEILDLIGNAQGDILFRGAAGWQVLAPVTDAFLQSKGAAADPVFTPVIPTVDTALVATGASQATALVLTKNWNEIATVAAATGVLLPGLGTGIESKVFNNGANALLVYPPVGGQIDTLGADTPYPLPLAKSQTFSQTAALQWLSTQLG